MHLSPVSSIMDPQAFQKFPAATEKCFNGIHQEALAEAPGLDEKIILSGFHQPVYNPGLVNIDKAVLPDFPAQVLQHNCRQTPSRAGLTPKT